MGSRRGNADRLPLGRYAVPDPDDEGRWTFWRVEQDGRGRVLRPWPPDVRWAPLRPPYPEGLDQAARREWTDCWYRDTYFEWKEAVVDAIAAAPQRAADLFAELAPDAELPAPTKPRPRSRPPARRKPVAAVQRRLAAERLMAAALKIAGRSFSEVGAELGVPKTTAIRRVQRGQELAIGDAVQRAMVSVRATQLMDQLMQACIDATPEDAARVDELVRRLQELQVRATGQPLGEGGAS